MVISDVLASTLSLWICTLQCPLIPEFVAVFVRWLSHESSSVEFLWPLIILIGAQSFRCINKHLCSKQWLPSKTRYCECKFQHQYGTPPKQDAQHLKPTYMYWRPMFLADSRLNWKRLDINCIQKVFNHLMINLDLFLSRRYVMNVR